MHITQLIGTQAIEQLLEVEARREEGVYDKDTVCVGVARLQVRPRVPIC
jgi:diphthamide biosynthesis methyltransferase